MWCVRAPLPTCEGSSRISPAVTVRLIEGAKLKYERGRCLMGTNFRDSACHGECRVILVFAAVKPRSAPNQVVLKSGDSVIRSGTGTRKKAPAQLRAEQDNDRVSQGTVDGGTKLRQPGNEAHAPMKHNPAHAVFQARRRGQPTHLEKKTAGLGLIWQCRPTRTHRHERSRAETQARAPTHAAAAAAEAAAARDDAEGGNSPVLP